MLSPNFSYGFLSLSGDKGRLMNLTHAPHAAFPCDPEIDLNKVEWMLRCCCSTVFRGSLHECHQEMGRMLLFYFFTCGNSLNSSWLLPHCMHILSNACFQMEMRNTPHLMSFKFKKAWCAFPAVSGFFLASPISSVASDYNDWTPQRWTRSR